MALIDHQRTGIRLEFLYLKFIRLLRLPHLGTEDLRHLILHHTTDPSRDTLTGTSIPLYQQFEQITMVQTILRERALPYTVCLLLQLIFRIFLPIVESTDQIDSRCVRCPLPKDPALLCLVQAKVEITGSHIRQGDLSIVSQAFFFCNRIVIPSLDSGLIGGQPRVLLNQIQRLHIYINDVCVQR